MSKRHDCELARCPEMTDSWQPFSRLAVAFECAQDLWGGCHFIASKINILACLGKNKKEKKASTEREKTPLQCAVVLSAALFCGVV